MSLTSLEKGVILFLIEYSSACDKEKLEALCNLENLLDPEIDGNLIITIRKMREKLTYAKRYEEDFDRFRFEFISTHGKNTVRWLKSRLREAEARKDVRNITELILPVVKLFEKTVNQRLLFAENSTFRLLLSLSSDFEELRKKIERIKAAQFSL